MIGPYVFLKQKHLSLCNIISILVLFLFLNPPVLAEGLNPKILESVVSILPEWPSDRRRNKEPEASAVAIFPGGYLATNDHVINLAKSIRVRLNNGRIIKAQIIGRDFLTDLALLKIPKNLPILPIGSYPTIGEKVCAIGNQFGLGLSVTCGVASALHRTGTGFNPIEDFIQTDAVVNPGGSGGALVDKEGNLVGLISAIFTKDNDANIGVNFATSTDLVLRVLREIKEKGRVVRGNPGFKVRNLTIKERQKFVGALIAQISKNSPAKKSGLREGDIIIGINKRNIIRTTDIPSAIHMVRLNVPITIRYIRNGIKDTTTLVLKK